LAALAQYYEPPRMPAPPPPARTSPAPRNRGRLEAMALRRPLH
jgi:hypothetical protein